MKKNNGLLGALAAIAFFVVMIIGCSVNSGDEPQQVGPLPCVSATDEIAEAEAAFAAFDDEQMIEAAKESMESEMQAHLKELEQGEQEYVASQSEPTEPEPEPEPKQEVETEQSIEPEDAQPEEPIQSEPQRITVYITRTGDHYHRSDCYHLRQSKIATTISQAKAKGNSACSHCHPPQ